MQQVPWFPSWSWFSKNMYDPEQVSLQELEQGLFTWNELPSQVFLKNLSAQNRLFTFLEGRHGETAYDFYRQVVLPFLKQAAQEGRVLLRGQKRLTTFEVMEFLGRQGHLVPAVLPSSVLFSFPVWRPYLEEVGTLTIKG